MSSTNYGFKANVTVGKGFAIFSGNGDVVSSGNVNLSGAVITADPVTGAVAIIPSTASTPNPTAIIISTSGSINTVPTVHGILPPNAFITAQSALATTLSTLSISGNDTVGGTLVVNGDTDVVNLNVSGNASLTNLTVTGSDTVMGNTQIGNLNATGTSALTGNAIINNMLITGTVSSLFPLNGITVGQSSTLYCASTNNYQSGYITASPFTVAQRDSTGGLTASSFFGVASQATALYSVSTNDYRSGSITASAFTIAQRDTNGNLTATYFSGTATSAQYADLAELYTADQEYEPGTVVVFGGNEEITTTTEYADPSVAGAVSTNPAYLMNKDLKNGTALALRGRIPVKVVGPVKKGDLLVTSSKSGFAESVGADRTYGVSIFAKSIETNLDDGEKVIEAVVL